MPKLKISKGLRKRVRLEKSRLRREINNPPSYFERLEQIYRKFNIYLPDLIPPFDATSPDPTRDRQDKLGANTEPGERLTDK